MVNCGNNSSPGVWLSGVAGVTISRLRIVSESVRVSMDSNGGRNNAANPSAQIEFDHDDFRSDLLPAAGRRWTSAAIILWLNVHDSTFENARDWHLTCERRLEPSIQYPPSAMAGYPAAGCDIYFHRRTSLRAAAGCALTPSTNGSASVYAAPTHRGRPPPGLPTVYEIIPAAERSGDLRRYKGDSPTAGPARPSSRSAAGEIRPCQAGVHSRIKQAGRGSRAGGSAYRGRRDVPGRESPEAYRSPMRAFPAPESFPAAQGRAAAA